LGVLVSWPPILVLQASIVILCCNDSQSMPARFKISIAKKMTLCLTLAPRWWDSGPGAISVSARASPLISCLGERLPAVSPTSSPLDFHPLTQPARSLENNDLTEDPSLTVESYDSGAGSLSPSSAHKQPRRFLRTQTGRC
jgi:hypothetical protein